MATKVIFKLNTAGFAQVLNGGEMQADIMRRARQVAGAAGDGHSVENRSSNRARATVTAESYAARKAEAEAHRLTTAIQAARA